MQKNLKLFSVDFAQTNAISYLRSMTATACMMAIAAIGSGYFLTTKLVNKRLLLDEKIAVLNQLKEQQFSNNEKTVAKKTITGPSSDEIKEINRVIGELNHPWSDFFDAIEAIESNIAIIAIEPDLSKNLIRISAESQNNEQMLRFLGDMREIRHFQNSFLTKYEINELDPNRPTRFSIETKWIKDSSK